MTPAASKQFEIAKKEASKYKVKWNGGRKYEVSGPWNDQCVVDVVNNTCTCRKWELTRLPCKHAIAANWNMTSNGQEIVGGAESWIHPCHWLETWKKVYSYKIGPINGQKMWPKSTCPTYFTPLVHHTPIGRPKKKRRQNEVEKEDTVIAKGNKLRKVGKPMTCSICKKPGHNKRGCNAVVV
jgi:hypothetical protein